MERYGFDGRVTIEVDGFIADVRLARPNKLNALDARMFDALDAAAAWLHAQPGVRAVVLSGDGDGFCAGLDMTHADDLASISGREQVAARSHGDANRFQRSAMAWHDLSVPVVAALHGVVFGGGFQIALGADLRFCSADARLSLMETRWGVVPDMGAMVLLPGLVRQDVARDLVLSARIVPADEALRLGLVTRICSDPRADALQYARELSTKSPRALSAAKRLLNEVFAATRAGLLLSESGEQLGLLGAEDHLEALRAHRERRAPSFR